MKVLHLFGSTQSRFYYDLSKMYAAAVLRPDGTSHCFASVEPSGAWRFGPEPDRLSAAMALTDALARLPDVDLVVPHMFCRAGMTTYRALVEDLLRLPLVGSGSAVAGLATSKIWTRDVVSAAGVRVAAGQRLDPGEMPGLAPPFVVKPNSEDNSLGVAVVQAPDEAERAVAHARRYDDVLLAEAFVPGREIRAAVIETGAEPFVPAFIEYPVSEARPIREVADKLEVGEAGGDMRQSRRAEAQPICPANVDPALAAQLSNAAIRAHRAIGARHYSLFDFRVHAETGEPHLLEAGLFWSFSGLSAITKMLSGAGCDPTDVTRRVWEAAVRGYRPPQVDAA